MEYFDAEGLIFYLLLLHFNKVENQLCSLDRSLYLFHHFLLLEEYFLCLYHEVVHAAFRS